MCTHSISSHLSNFWTLSFFIDELTHIQSLVLSIACFLVLSHSLTFPLCLSISLFRYVFFSRVTPTGSFFLFRKTCQNLYFYAQSSCSFICSRNAYTDTVYRSTIKSHTRTFGTCASSSIDSIDIGIWIYARFVHWVTNRDDQPSRKMCIRIVFTDFIFCAVRNTMEHTIVIRCVWLEQSVNVFNFFLFGFVSLQNFYSM